MVGRSHKFLADRLADHGLYANIVYDITFADRSKRKLYNPYTRGLKPVVPREVQSWQRTAEILHNQWVIMAVRAYNLRVQIEGIDHADYLFIPPLIPLDAEQIKLVKLNAPKNQEEMLAMTDAKWLELEIRWPELAFPPNCTTTVLRMLHYQRKINAIESIGVPEPRPPPTRTANAVDSGAELVAGEETLD